MNDRFPASIVLRVGLGILSLCLFAGTTRHLPAEETNSPVAATDTLPPPATSQVGFEQQIAPLLKAKCFSCHAGEEEAGGLRLDVKQRALDGGDNGPVIVPGKSA